MKKILSLFFGFLCIFAANAAQVANVEYVHTLIEQEWDISIPYNSALSDVHTVANMKYLLTAIDVANEILNGEPTTNYGNGEFATLQVADTVATNQAVETLIKKEEKAFYLTTTSGTSSFSFSIGAAGNFVIDWGDGKTETITKPDTKNTTYSHTYGTSKSYTIKLTGRATAYGNADSSICFEPSASKIASIDGSLGAIFGTLPDGSQPTFFSTFYMASNIKSIPDNLFAGISGAPVKDMFANTFWACSNLTSIPAGLFSGISGAPAEGMFFCTFEACSKLTSIPDGLFAGISGAPAREMFQSTFSGCSRLTGAIPENLFGNISGPAQDGMFYGTFSGCSRLTGAIPENLFGNISGPAQYGMFYSTFSGCTSLTGPSARINGQYLYEIWPDATSLQVGYMYQGATRLSDYSNIPSNWK